MRYPTLVGITILMRTLDTTHPQNYGAQTEGPRIVNHVLVRRALRASVGAAELQAPAFVDPLSCKSTQRRNMA